MVAQRQVTAGSNGNVDISGLRAALDGQVDGEVRFDPGSLAAYAHDGSNYRQVPVGVVVPRTVDAAAAAIAACRQADIPVLSRGGGTSLAGQCCNEAVVIDWTKYCHQLVSLDAAAKTAVVEPGAVLDEVNDAVAAHGLMVGPKPSTHVSCTIGGMIGNNSCGSTAQAYGHFGHGCVHTRIPFELRTKQGAAKYRSFVETAADLVVSYGGSLSGEHGDGQSRGELLPKMFGPELMRAFGEMKATFDPGNRMNPGKVVQPYRLDQNLTLRGWFPPEPRTFFHYPQDDHKFTAAASRCVGVGKCRGDEGGVMCPSYRVTREEEHSTRGRSRLLLEMVRGEVITGGWHSTEVRDALDLCLACKGCRKDCPVDVDMATYKAEFLAHHYKGRLRPASHYSMGWLPAVALLAARAPAAVNAAGRAPGLARLLKLAGGIDAHRELPRFARERFTRWYARRGARRTGPPVILWPDTFTNSFHPDVGQAAVSVLENAGFTVEVPTRTLCCGLTWISTGQLGVAGRVLKRTIAALRPALQAGRRVVVLEPSCAAVFRSDAAELLGSDDARLLARQTTTLAELLGERGWRPPPSAGGVAKRKAIAQVHCHQHAIMGFDADSKLLRACGVDLDVLDAGCCGLAGNFGFERGHYDVSVACAEHGLWPAVRNADPATAVLADGFSCRTQIEAGHLGREGIHLAQLLAGMLGEDPDGREDRP
jgi:Fe-S oxidoreductase